MLWILLADKPDPNNPLIKRKVVFAHASTDEKVVKEWVRTQSINIMTQGVRYSLHKLPQNDPTIMIVAIEYNFDPVRTSGQAVQAGNTSPQGQRGQNRPDGPRSHDGFQELGDAALTNNNDTMFTDGGNEYYSDLLVNGNVSQEMRR